MATMKMSGCLALVAKMPEADQDALLARVDQYQADGIPAERAQVMAANDVLAEIRAERSQLMSAIAEQHPDLLTADALSDPSAEDQALSFSRRRKADPEKTVTAYKLFRVNEKNPGQLFPLFIGKNDPVEVGTWYDADDIPTKGFSARPGWHAGDSPMASHIGEKSRAGLTAPDRRPANQVWAEIEMSADVDWQAEANKRGTNAQGKVVAVKADIKDQIPEDGFYRYKTNPNMTGNWLIGGSIKVNRVLTDAEVEAINDAAGVADLPREEPFDAEKYGLGTKLSRSRQTDTPAPRVTPTRQRQEVERNADAIAAMGADTRDNTELGDFPGGPEAYNLYEARTLLKKPSDKLKRVTERNTFSLWQNYDYLANVDGELFGVTKQEDPDEVDDETKFIYSFENLANGTSRETVTDQTDELFAEMRASMGGAAMMSRSRQPDTPEFKRWFGGSKVVNGLGQPRVVYHGTASDFSIFDINQAGKTYRKPEERGFFFTGRLETAESAADDATGLPIYARRYANEGFGGGMDRGGDAYDTYDDGEAYDSTADYNGGQNIMPVYLSIQNPLIVDAREGNGAGSEFENGSEAPEQMIERAKREGHDGIIIRGKYRNYESIHRIQRNSWMSEEQKRSALDKLAREDARKRRTDNYFIAFRADQIKSAIGNTGAYGQRPVTDEEANRFGMGGADAQYRQYEGDISFSRQRIVGESKRAYTPEQLQYFENVGRTVTTPTLKERIAELRKDLGKKMAQGIADQFRPISDLGQKAYALARLSRGSSGAFEALLHHGKLSLKDGVYDADQSGGFIERVGVPLQGELEDFLWWVAANRAERLTAEDRERLFTAQDIAAGKSLDQGTADFDYVLQHGPRGGQTTRDRTLIFRDALKTFDEFNKNTLDMAEQSGLIDGASRKIWEHEFYVPFYRVAEEGNDGFSGAAIKNSLVRQEAFKKLKGGKEKLNSDLLANTLANWGHLIDAASKNRAAKETLVAAANLGAAVEADEATIKSMAAAAGKKNQRTWFMDGGVKRHFLIEDQAVVTALTSLDYAGLRGPLWDALTAPKHWLTIGVTASPHFKIKNLIRDSVQAIATSELSYNPVKNIAEGVRASDRNSQTYVSALASGGLIRFGTMLEGSTSKRTRQLIKMGVKDATILDSDNKVQAMYDKFLEPMVMAYNEIGNRGEEINRASLFKQLTDNGMDQAQAALMARDLMDFSMQGSWTWVRVLTQVVPFLNARIQGMYKLGRSAVDDPKRFGIVLGAVAAASVSLLLAYEDDDDWKKREDWDRDTYWWFKVGGTAFRIPKPFEIGAIGTLAERGLEYFMSPEMTNKRFRKVVSGLMLDQLSMNPVPQVFKPLLDLYSNKDSFTGRPIETMGMEKVKPQYRFTDRTSILARGLSTGTFGALSPVQYDHLVRGYFAWLGSMVVTATDAVLRPVTGQGERATPDYWKLATGGLVSDTSSASSRYVSQMYEQAKELEQAMGTYRMLMKTGRLEEGREFFKDNKQDIVKSAAVDRVKAAESRYNEMIRMIERSKLDPDVKRDRIQAVQVQKDKIARLVAPGYAR